MAGGVATNTANSRTQPASVGLLLSSFFDSRKIKITAL